MDVEWAERIATESIDFDMKLWLSMRLGPLALGIDKELSMRDRSYACPMLWRVIPDSKVNLISR